MEFIKFQKHELYCSIIQKDLRKALENVQFQRSRILAWSTMWSDGQFGLKITDVGQSRLDDCYINAK